MPSFLLRRLAPLVLAGLALSACSTFEERPAASVNGTDISADDLEEEVDAIRGNEDYLAAYEEQVAPVNGTSRGSFTTALASELLNQITFAELIRQWLDERGVEITDEDRELGAQAFQSRLQGLYEDFPDWYQDELAAREAVFNKVLQEDDVVDEVLEGIEVSCASHILFTTESRSSDEARRLAEAAKAEIDGGADFADVASEQSEDGSASQGGELGCLAPGATVAGFEEALFSQEIGEVGEPVQSEFGWHVILVTDRQPATLEDLGQEGGNAILTALLGDLTCEQADVFVNPRYGRWDTSPCDEGELARITPPRGASSAS